MAQEGSVSEQAEAALAQLSKDPKFQSILQKHLEAEANSTRAHYENLPIHIKKRVRALKNIHVDVTKLEAQFYEEVQVLEAKYQLLYEPLLNKRGSIVNGQYEPTEEECKWSFSEDEEDDDKPKAISNGVDTAGDDGDSAVKDTNGANDESADKGIPEFWLTAMKHTDIFDDYIMEHDEAILKYLTDIKVVYADDKGLNFKLEFHFSDNQYFTNSVLTKDYTVSCAVPADDPFSFEGATITDVKGCKIDWKKGMNVTVKTVKKKQKHKGKGQSRVISKTVPNDSFFNFFSPPDPDTFEQKEEEEVEDLSLQLETDISRAEFIRDRLVPKAVLYYTGDIIDDEEEDDDLEGSDEEDEDDDSEDPDDYNPNSDLTNSKPPECKQQ